MTPILAPRAIDAARIAAALDCALVIDLVTGRSYAHSPHLPVPPGHQRMGAGIKTRTPNEAPTCSV